MNKPSMPTPSRKFLVGLYSDPNFLALSILENLLSKNCFINIFTGDVQSWKAKTAHLSGNNRFAILPGKGSADNQKFNYSVFCGGFIKSTDAYKDCKNFLSTEAVRGAKTLLILPSEIFDSGENSTLPINDNIGIVYVGDLLGPRFDLRSDLTVSQHINEILIKRSVSFSIGEVLYPIFITDAAKELTKWLFSFGPYGKEIFLLGRETPTSVFWDTNRKLVGELKFYSQKTSIPRVLPRGFEIRTVGCNLSYALSAMYRWFSVAGTGEAGVIKKARLPYVVKKPTRKYPKFVEPLVISLSLIVLFPFFTIILAIGSFYISSQQYLAGKGNPASFLLVAKTFSVMSAGESRALSYIPLLGLIYRETGYIGDSGSRLVDLTLNFIDFANAGTQLFNGVLGKDVYDPTIFSREMSGKADYLYQNVSLWQADTKGAVGMGVISARQLLNRVDFDRIKNLVFQGKVLAERLPTLLGKDERKSYLVLFENNMELRPTGGFIGSFGILTFDGGRLSEMTVSDVYSADGQLKGHVEPPVPIKKYLGEANWWLRDSNWDPDFSTSAKRAEWFLDKELGQDVDGVVAIDLTPIRDILKYTGPVFLSDYNLNITSQNLYETTQSEAEENFFPGSHKKASFLTALSQNLTSEVGKIAGAKKSLILAAVFNSLEGRHIQLFLHDNSQDAISSLAWDGSVSVPPCGDTCYGDLVGVVEANLGVNKANYFIKRAINLNVVLDKGNISRDLTLTLENTANPSLGPSGRYRSYIRLLVPSDADILSAVAVAGEGQGNLLPEISDLKGRKEVGVWVEILPSQKKEIKFSWISKLPNDSQLGSYGLYFRKQAGTSEDPLNVSVKGGGLKNIGSTPFVLTKGGDYQYNTTLARDLVARFSWHTPTPMGE